MPHYIMRVLSVCLSVRKPTGIGYVLYRLYNRKQNNVEKNKVRVSVSKQE